MKTIITILAAVLFTANVFAQTPNLMSYQAVIRSSSNGPLITNHGLGMRISILENSQFGQADYVETQADSTNANGLVTLQIGAGTVVYGTFSSINWGAHNYYIKIETDPTSYGASNYSITSISQLLSVPYALYAASGNQGTPGTNGTNGATWYTGSGAPSGATGSVNDLYLNTATSDYYQKTGASTWTLQGNLAGLAGTNGNNGTTWYTGSGTPSGATGVLGDLYLNIATGDYYKKTGANSWTLQANLTGPQGTNGNNGTSGTNGTNGTNGATWYTASGAPSGATGVINDLYLNVATGDYYKKTGASTWTLQGNLTGMAGTNGTNGTNGATWYTGSGAPSGATGVVNDLYLNTSNNNYYEKTGVSTWTLQGNLTVTYIAGSGINISADTIINDAQTDATLAGHGTSQSPLKIAQQNASNGQVLKWNNSSWAPANDSLGVTAISGTSNYVSKFTGANTIGNSLIFDNGTNIGIGTTTTTSTINVAGNQDTTGSFVNTSTSQNNFGVSGSCNNTPTLGTGVIGIGGSNGVAGFATLSGGGDRTGVHGYATNGTGNNYGVLGEGVGGTTAYGVYGFASGATTDWAGYFGTGNVYIQNNLDIGNTGGNGFPLAVTGNNTSRAGDFTNNGTDASWGILSQCNVGTANYGIGIEGDGSNIGVRGNGQTGVIGNGTSTGTGSIGVWATTSGAGTNYAVYADGDAGSATANYGIFARASGATTNWAGYFVGNTYCTSGVWQSSDRNLKNDIQPLSGAMDIINRLKPSVYTFKTSQYKQMNLPEGLQYGLIADEVQQVVPGAVKKAVQPAEYENHDEKNGKKLSDEVEFNAVNYTEMVPILIAGMKEQQQQIEELKNEIKELKQQVLSHK